MHHPSGHSGRRLLQIIILIVLPLALAPSPYAQDVAATTTGQRAESLRTQLRELADKEAALQMRLKQLDEELQPENIQNRTALTGTLDANALRDQLRRELEGQKAGVQQQLELLAASRARLETGVAEAETEAVRRSAAALAPTSATASVNATPTPVRTAQAMRPLPSVKTKRQAVRRKSRSAAGSRRRHP